MEEVRGLAQSPLGTPVRGKAQRPKGDEAEFTTPTKKDERQKPVVEEQTPVRLPDMDIDEAEMSTTSSPDSIVSDIDEYPTIPEAPLLHFGGQTALVLEPKGDDDTLSIRGRMPFRNTRLMKASLGRYDPYRSKYVRGHIPKAPYDFMNVDWGSFLDPQNNLPTQQRRRQMERAPFRLGMLGKRKRASFVL
jgi:hypothetical protein